MPRTTAGPAYRHEHGHTLVEVRLRDVRQLFHTLDPAPFLEQDLDDEAERYLIDAYREAGTARPVRVVIHLPASAATSADAAGLPDAIRHYFAYRARQLRADLRRLLRAGVVSLAIAGAFLLACLWLRDLVGRTWRGDPDVIMEGLLILGWVAMWRPVELLLYDWWPIAQRWRLLHGLATMPVDVRGDAPAEAFGVADGTQRD